MLHRSQPRAIVVALLCAVILLGTSPVTARTGAAGAASAACQTFPETNKTICGRFLEYWQANGGLAQQGLPLTDEFIEVNPTDSKPYLTQYFERARFELHPLNPAPYDVLLGLLGREQVLAKYPSGVPTGSSGNPLGTACTTFTETGKQVCGTFLSYWDGHGGLAQQGLPLTDLFLETNPTDGKQYPTQYFERARFEYHVENLGTPYVVLLGLLGREQLQAKYPNVVPTGPAPSASPSALPPAPTSTPTKVPMANCDPSYPTVCIPPPPPDLDCKDIPYRNFKVLAPDPHKFDSDKDGIGCES